MKTKNFEKKLVLKKENIARLDNSEMKQLQGGAYTLICETWMAGPCLATNFPTC